MHSTTTCINTTFELADVGLGSFHTPVRCLPSGLKAGRRSGPSGRGLGWELDPGGRLAFRLSRDCLDFLGSRSLSSVPTPLAGVPGSGGGALGWSVCGSDWGVGAPPWLGCGFGRMPGLWCAVVAFL
ncbi:hypothetical protein ATANTOWER_003262 [Ataeniobius toweri]|uniref:Uncharacterized protein n=1 Tax=Ataeniobius toweri TaxID=208326 RepID=A0ABU7BMD1_9TELE|nr:hypothetical protein [Ataeniobius toweri]